jgi:hypothetical protein
MKKTYISPAITVAEIEVKEEMLSVSGWTPDGNKNNGFGIVEEDDSYSDDDF